MANDDGGKDKQSDNNKKPTEKDRVYRKGEKEKEKQDKTLSEDDDTNRGSLRRWPGSRGRSED